jgi:ribosomal protein L11 methyltransferase
MEWQQFVMNLETLNPASVEEILFRHGAQSVTFSDAGDKPVLEPGPGETPLWNSTRITGLFEAGVDMAGLLADLRATFELEAFGTGTHATTAMCLEWLDTLDMQGRTLLDYGCGSGVLAIAALKLGCECAHAMDIDPQAVIAARQNAADNGVEGRLTVSGSAEAVEGTFDVVVANILAGPLAELAADIAGHVSPGGRLGLSGILSEQADDVQEAYAEWVEFDEPEFRPQGGQTWTRLTGRKRHV